MSHIAYWTNFMNIWCRYDYIMLHIVLFVYLYQANSSNFMVLVITQYEYYIYDGVTIPTLLKKKCYCYSVFVSGATVIY